MFNGELTVNSRPSLVDEAKNLHIISTGFYRTLTSAYAEASGLLGMWDGKAKVRTLKQHELKGLKRYLPFKTRRNNKINK